MKKEKVEDLKNVASMSAAFETVQRHGSAVKEHIVSYTGIDNATGKVLKKSLKSIANEKVDPKFEYQNLKQQAGFAAEVKESANANADAIIKGSDTRKVRTDDLGSVNDPLYDHVKTNAAGNIIPGSGSQMKFVGKTPKEALDKFMSKKYDKYLDNDVDLEVPSDFYSEMLNDADKRIEQLKNDAQKQRALGKNDSAAQTEKKIEKLQRIKSKLKKSSVSSDEAMEARINPVLSTAKSVVKVSHKAGLKTAGQSAAIGGSVSIIQNLVSLVKGEQTEEEAIKNVAKDTATSAAMGYGTGFVGSVIKGGMQNASSKTVQALSNTNLPSTIVTVAVSSGKTLKRYFKGEIDGVQCLEDLGESGTGMVASAFFSAIGQAAIPIPFVGAAIGGMIGYALSSASYQLLVTSLKEEKLAKEERARIERECEEHINLIRGYRAEMESIIGEYLQQYADMFHSSFDNMKIALNMGDVDGFISSASQITEAFGKEALFNNFDEFDSIMLKQETIKF